MGISSGLNELLCASGRSIIVYAVMVFEMHIQSLWYPIPGRFVAAHPDQDSPSGEGGEVENIKYHGVERLKSATCKI